MPDVLAAPEVLSDHCGPLVTPRSRVEMFIDRRDRWHNVLTAWAVDP
jgi:hypothetical protein